ncbi:choice-of-anchor I family protein [Bacillus sp. FJAT-42315]|uniref:choice-of-anchor I family protein n=1 Tax=Bacillus sp. FJAT-42315 TaxID=2014077 RepID=UPI000C23AF8A|nr:choice-of-anchor I family protein [Bacillus sp. FJAT-42315]
MNFKKTMIAGIAATGLLFTSGAPYNAMAEAPPFYQYEGEGFPVQQIAQYDSLAGEGGTEILAYDTESKQAFVTNGAKSGLDILSFGNLKSDSFQNIPSKKRILVKDFGIEQAKDITSVAVHPTKDIVALSVVSDPKTDPGFIVFLTKQGEFLTKVQVGALPDMVTFTPDGQKVLVANEGEPNDDYSVDPEGSISMIDISKGVKKNETLTAKTLTFTNVPLDDQVRVGSKGTVLQQLEPEYISVTADSKKAFVSLQENNAIATIDLEANKIVNVKGLGVKDHSIAGNELDGKKDKKINIEKLPLLGYYMPDAIDVYTTGGKTYILTPNEGDARDYAAYSEEAKIKDIQKEIKLDAKHYQGYTQEELDKLTADGLLDQLADTNITTENGKVNGTYESLHTYGARSFSIFDAETMELVFDSGSQFETIIAKAQPEYFNTTNDEIAFDKRSSAKGPEPETVVKGSIDGKNYAFVALERQSAIMVYDITNPKQSKFVTMVSSRDFSADVKGDVSPEGLQFIAADKSPTGQPLLMATHEVSGTVAVYELGTKQTNKLLPFKDVDQDHWSYSYILDLYEKNIIQGKTKTTFAPGETVTRIQYVAMLSRALDLKPSSNKTTFKDVPAWAAKDVQAAFEAGIINGETATTFAPYESITREQMAAMSVRAYESKGGKPINGPFEDFKDAGKINTYAKAFVQKASRLGIMEGKTNGEFGPKEPSTRAQSAKVLSIMLDKLEK